jgi:PAS domain S-box-containing protein
MIHLAPLFFILLTFLADVWIPAPVFTPILASLALMLMAFRYSVPQMLLWTFLYSVVVTLIFLNPKILLITNGWAYQDTLTPYLWMVMFYVAATLSCIVSFALDRLKKADLEKMEILKLLPIPILTSDEQGKIVYMNKAAEKMFGFDATQASWRSYFDMIKGEHLELSEEYVKRLKDNQQLSSEVFPMIVSRTPVEGYLHRLKTMRRKLILTVLCYNTSAKDFSR